MKKIPVDVVCPTTGIPFAVLLETPIRNLSCYHPFSIDGTVRDIVAQSLSRGLTLESMYSAPVLSGMLICLLQNADLTVCRNPEAANKYLSNASPRCISNVIRFLVSRTSYKDMPKLALVDFSLHHLFGLTPSDGVSILQAEVEGLLNNYIRACTGHTVENGRIMQPSYGARKSEKNKEGKIRVYTDKARQEATALRDNKDRGNVLLKILQNGYANKYPKVLADIQNALKNISTMRKDKRNSLADMMEMIFEESSAAAELAEILRTASSTEIQKDMIAVATPEEVAAIKDTTTGKIKVDFMSKLKEN